MFSPAAGSQVRSAYLVILNQERKDCHSLAEGCCLLTLRGLGDKGNSQIHLIETRFQLCFDQKVQPL